jgi:hypothetical protein
MTASLPTTPVRYLRALASAIPVIAVIVLIGALVAQRHALAGRTALLEELRPQALRVAVTDRLIGRRVPEIVSEYIHNGYASPDTVGRGYVAWIVAPRECPDCLSDVRIWNSFAMGEARPPILILTGVSADSAQRIAQGAGVRTRLVADPDSKIRHALGLSLPSTHLFIDREGIIRMADARYSITKCNVGFLAQVNAMRLEAVGAGQ